MDSDYEDLITGNVTRPGDYGLAQDPFDEFGNRADRFDAPPEPEYPLARGEAPPPRLLAPEPAEPPTEPGDELGRLRPPPPATDPGAGKDDREFLDQAAEALQSRGHDWGIPDVSGAGLQMGEEKSEPAPVPVQDYVRNQYGEKVKPYSPGQPATILNARGEDIGTPIKDEQGNVVGTRQRQAPTLHKGTLAAIYERANAAVPPIPPGNWSREQLYHLTLHRNDKVAAVAQNIQAHEQRRQLHLADLADKSAESQRHERAKQQNELAIVKAKADATRAEAEAKSRERAEARRQESESVMQKRLKEHFEDLKKEKARLEDYNALPANRSKPKPIPDYLQDEKAMAAKARQTMQALDEQLHPKPAPPPVADPGGAVKGAVKDVEEDIRAKGADAEKKLQSLPEDVLNRPSQATPERSKEVLGVIKAGLSQIPPSERPENMGQGGGYASPLYQHLATLHAIHQGATGRNLTNRELLQHIVAHAKLDAALRRHGQNADRLRLVGG